MPRFIYAHPIIPGKSHVVRYVFRQRRENPQLVGDEAGFRKDLGLEAWQAWLQKTPQGDFFIHSIESQSLELFFSSLGKLIKAQHPKALWLRDFFLEVIGRDYSDPSAAPTLLQLFEMDVAGPLPDKGEIVSQGYILPLLPKKTDGFRELCRQLRGEHRGRAEDACRHLHINKITCTFQKALAHDYAVIYRERILLPQEQARRPHEVRAEKPSYQWLSNQLMDLTGLTFDQLEPQLEYLSPQPLATLSPWSHLQPALR